MKQTDILIELLNHMEWADSIVWKTVLKCKQAEDDKKIKDILLHYYTAQQKYFSVWLKKPSDVFVKDDIIELNSLVNRVILYYKELHEFLLNLGEYMLDENIIYPGIERIKEILGKTPEEVNFTETVLQVIIHTSHHRGQVNKRLREIGGFPDTIDFIAWVWLGKPGAIWKELKGLQ